MISRILAVSVVGAVLFLIGLSQTSLTARRNDVVDAAVEYTEDGQEIEYITLEDIAAMMELDSFEMNVAGGEGGLRKLPQEDDTCWHSGQPNQRMWFAVSVYSEAKYCTNRMYSSCTVYCAPYFTFNDRVRSGHSPATTCTLAFVVCNLDSWLSGVDRNAVPAVVDNALPLKCAVMGSISIQMVIWIQTMTQAKSHQMKIWVYGSVSPYDCFCKASNMKKESSHFCIRFSLLKGRAIGVKNASRIQILVHLATLPRKKIEELTIAL